MARDDDSREIDDTTIIAGGQQAWSEVDPPGATTTPPAGSVPDPAAGPRAEPEPGNGMPVDGGPTGGDQADRDQADGAPTEVLQTAAAGDVPFSPENAQASDSTDLADVEPGASATPPVPHTPPGPVLVANGLGLLTKSGWVFKDIDLTLRPASVAAVVGPSGTGRSCLLLSLCGRMETNTGSLVVSGHSMRDKPAAIRAVTAVARIGTLAVPEPSLTVRESVDERCLLEDVDTRVGRTRYEEACAALQYRPEPMTLVSSLIGEQATLFAIALACVRPSAVIVLDDLDRGVSAAMQQTILDALIRLARTGPTVVVSTTDRIPVMEADVVLDLTPQDGAMLWQFEPAAAITGGMLEQLDPHGDQRSPVPPELGPGSLTPPPPPPPADPEPADERDKNSDAPTEDPR